MSLRLLLPEDAVADLLTRWPDEVRVYDRPCTALDRELSTAALFDWIDTGCAPTAEIAVVKAPHIQLTPLAYSTHGRTDATRLRKHYDSGHTIRVGNLQRVMPFMAHLTRGIQQETGYSNYAHAFFTPPSQQGLQHHWDQQMAIIVQVAGTKRWELWKPVVDAPMREHLESFRVWRDDYLPTWTAAGPDQVVDLRAGQAMLLPRGWVHNPYNADPDEPSVHLTFAIRERTPYWIAEELVKGAIHDPAFRQIVLPCDLNGPSLQAVAEKTRNELLAYLEGLDPVEFADGLRRLARTTLEYTT